MLDRNSIIAFTAIIIVAIFGQTSLGSSICPAAEVISPCKCHDYIKLIDCDGLRSVRQLRHIFARLDAELKRAHIRPTYEQFKLVDSRIELINDTADHGGGDLFSGVTFRRISMLRNSLLRRIEPAAFRRSSTLNVTIELVFEDNVRLGGDSAADAQALFDTVTSFRAVQICRISDAGLRVIPDHAFAQSLPSLRELFLTDNRIETVGDNAFTGLSALQLLNLDGNQISSLAVRSFEFSLPNDSPARLKILLRSNRLNVQSFPVTIFNRLRRPISLDLSHNNMTGLPRRIFHAFFLRRNVLSLHKNPLRCDCEFRWLLAAGVLYNSSDPEASRDALLRKYQCVLSSGPGAEGRGPHSVNGPGEVEGDDDDDDDHVIHEVDSQDFAHCDTPQDGGGEHDDDDAAKRNRINVSSPPNADNSIYYRNCIERTLEPEAEHACLNGASGDLYRRRATLQAIFIAFSLILPLLALDEIRF